MANPRDLAEQAFALLQNALSASEARASDLDEQLKRKRAPKTRLEDQLDVLSHRLESVETERTRWEQQAAHLEEVAEAERVKVAQLKKKLQIAESGPEKLTKKEVNFWRAKSEQIDAQVKEYQERLATLRRELNERDTQLEKLKAAGGAETTERHEPQEHGDDELRRQLEQRDRWLAELRLELHELRGQPSAPLETEAQVETLRSQVASLERALAEAHNMRAAVKADLARTEQQLAERERVTREAAATGEHARTTLAEREHRITQLSAEIEHLRNDLCQREDRERSGAEQQNEQVAALEGTLQEREQEIERQRQLLLANENDFAALRKQIEEREQAVAEARRKFEEQSLGLQERDRELAARQLELQELSQTLAERDQQDSTSAADLERLRATLGAQAQEADGLRETLRGVSAEFEHARATLIANERELASLRDALDTANRELAELPAERQRVDDAREQIAGLEAELKEEREHAESLGELANERREHMTKLQEQLEEAEERLADANWRLGKAQYFERLVKRRKGLINKLLAALRAKMKSNTALKAGLDGLRTFKATSEMNQHKLLQRIDALKADLKEADETVKRHQGGTAAKEELVSAVSRATALEDRLNTQAELIQSLEADLKAARLSHKTGDHMQQEVDRLTQELETKNQVIARLQADTDEQQRKLSKLRGSESETVRLKAMTEKDRGEIDSLQREVAQLREALARQAEVAAANSNTSDLEAKLKEREHSVTRLMGTIKENEATIKKLNESAESWKRKYQFLATDQPDAYKTAAEQ